MATDASEAIHSHPLSIPDGTARMRQIDDSLEMGGEERLNPEEARDNGPDTPYSHARNEPSASDIKKGEGGGRKGGGVGARSLLEEGLQNGLNVDPELLFIGLDDEGREEKKKSDGNNWSRRIQLDRIGYDSPKYDKLMDLSKVWTDPDTQVTYVVGGRHEEDKIVFKNPLFGWRSKDGSSERTLAIGELDKILEDSDISLSIIRPKHEEDKRFIDDLKHLRLGTGVLRGEKVGVEFSRPAQERQEEDKNFFKLKLNRKALDKFATTQEKSEVEDFWGLWTHAGKGEVVWAGFVIGRSKEDRKARAITGVSLVDKDGETYTIPAHIFRNVVENVGASRKPGSLIPTGFEFMIPGERHESVYPGVSLAEAVKIMKKIKIDGVALQDGVKFFLGDEFQKSA